MLPWSPMVSVSIIGLGPWGLSALERLVEASRRSPLTRVTVHVVEPGTPGGGMYSQDHPDYLVLNTPCGQHSMYPFPDLVPEGRLGRGFYEWVAEQGYRWVGTDCRILAPGDPAYPASRAISPHDFLPRRLMGAYLEWFYRALVSEAPPNMEVIHHRSCAVDLEPAPEGQEKVLLQDGGVVLVDQVVLTTGHIKETAARGVAGTSLVSPYPIEPYVSTARPGDKIGIEGMGLVALDVVTALTVGLGGHYTAGPEGTLTYHPSGREPTLYLFSRSGYPYCGKSFGAADPMGDYEPQICTLDAIASLKGQSEGAGGRKRQIDARRELLPLVFAEMELCYYVRSAFLAGGREAALEVRHTLGAAWSAGTFAEQKAQLAARYGEFSAEDHFFAGRGHHYHDGGDYQAQVYATVAEDTRQAMVPGGSSPIKAALETLRALRDTLRTAIEFKGLTYESHLDFVASLRNRFARLVAGQPAFRSQELLALIDAGIVRLPLGPSPEVDLRPDGSALLRSTTLDEPFEVEVGKVVRAHLDLPSIAASSSPLLANLVRRGRVRPLNFDGRPAGSVDLTEDFHPVNAAGGVERRLWLFGVLSEGVRYFTLYIPSPKSRVRAFLDAEICANEIVGVRGDEVDEADEAFLAEPAPAPAGTRERSSRTALRPAVPVVPVAPAVLRIALVNNMSDGAFEETERQFRSLLPGTAATPVEMSLFTLPGVVRSPRVQQLVADRYRELSDLWAYPPDALIITGAEPKHAELTEELYWPAMERLLWWGRSAVPSMLLSCLTAHAGLWAFDGLPRSLLLQKCCGVFPQVLDRRHPLMAGVDDVALPHSRFNEIPVADLGKAGYSVLAQSPGCGWTVAVGERGQCQVLLLQGHPEYAPHTLLREYRRDVRRYLSGDQGSYPHMPEGYLRPEGVELLERFRAEVINRPRDPALMDGLPFELAASHVTVSWQPQAEALMGNWLRSVRDRATARFGRSPQPGAPGVAELEASQLETSQLQAPQPGAARPVLVAPPAEA